MLNETTDRTYKEHLSTCFGINPFFSGLNELNEREDTLTQVTSEVESHYFEFIFKRREI